MLAKKHIKVSGDDGSYAASAFGVIGPAKPTARDAIDALHARVVLDTLGKRRSVLEKHHLHRNSLPMPAWRLLGRDAAARMAHELLDRLLDQSRREMKAALIRVQCLWPESMSRKERSAWRFLTTGERFSAEAQAAIARSIQD